MNFEVGDMVLAQLRKERYPKGEYNKLKMKKIEPCKNLRKFSANAYELELPPCIGISPIFNVAYLYSYTADDSTQYFGNLDHNEGKEQQWLKKMPLATILEDEHILDTRVTKKTMKKEYLEYLVKWKDRPVEDYT